MNGTTTQAPLTLDIKGAAALLGVSDDLMYRMVHIKDFPSFRMGRKILIDRRKLEDWLEDWLEAQTAGQIETWR